MTPKDIREIVEKGLAEYASAVEEDLAVDDLVEWAKIRLNEIKEVQALFDDRLLLAQDGYFVVTYSSPERNSVYLCATQDDVDKVGLQIVKQNRHIYEGDDSKGTSDEDILEQWGDFTHYAETLEADFHAFYKVTEETSPG